ncbi:hypothetical protein [Acaryochloris marina]|uniref:hypothetical protein n=1 Tax=Acaryochloris marina TaxID=155978 RepID=UPI0021C447A3|nr:hypothetical protein [Acaryochloris marina]BDM83807.1 hypothetical protein AM10699_66680 [Acaryochloris marina MBIC10699]
MSSIEQENYIDPDSKSIVFDFISSFIELENDVYDKEKNETLDVYSSIKTKLDAHKHDEKEY